MGGITRDERTPQAFNVDWSAVHAGLNVFKRAQRPLVDPFLVGRAVQGVMKMCDERTAAGRPLVWNEYAVFLNLDDWEHVKKLEGTLVRDLAGIVEKQIRKSKAEMVGPFTIRLLRDEGGTVKAGRAVIKVDFSEAERKPREDLGEMTVRVRATPVPLVAEPTQRVPELRHRVDDGAPARLRVVWPGGEAVIREGERVTLGRPHPVPVPGFVALAGANSRINKRQLWIEAGNEGAVIGRLSEANPVQVKGRLVQAGGHIAIDSFPADITLSSGELTLTVDRVQA